MPDANPFERDEPLSTKPIRLPDPEGREASGAQYLAAEFQCLDHVDHFKTGGFGDAVAQVVARWREVFRHVTIEVPRPKRGIRRLQYVCPMCGKPVELQTKSWMRTNLPPLCLLLLLGLVIAIIGWFNIPGLGQVGVGIAIAGFAIVLGPPLLMMSLPRLLDSYPGALKIVKDVPRDQSMFPTPGVKCPDTSDYSELAGRGMNQHKLEKVRLVHRD
jgi:hypothetical protein